MDRINYAGESFLTGSSIAHALLDYAQALAQTGSAATVTIPTIGAGGERASSEVLVGPASQLMSTGVATDLVELVDEELVGRLLALANDLRSGTAPVARPHVGEEPPSGQFSEFGI